MASLYDILDVTTESTSEDIKRAYYKKALQLHPDKNPDDPEATHKFQELSKAYDTISNPEKRNRYDRKGYADDSEDEDEYEFEDAQNLFDVIAEMFMQRGGFGSASGDMFTYAAAASAGQFGYYTTSCHTCEDEYYDSDPEVGDGGHRFVRENYHVHEDAARRSERRSREILEERRANAALPKISRPKLKAKTDTTITISWSAPGRVDCSGYDLESKTATGEWEFVKSGAETTQVVEGLAPGTQYYFRVRARKDDRFGEWSQDSFYSTQGSAKPKVEAAPVAAPSEDAGAGGKKKKKKGKVDDAPAKAKEAAAKEAAAAEKKAEEEVKRAANKKRQKEESERKAKEEAERKAKKEQKKANRQAKKEAEQLAAQQGGKKGKAMSVLDKEKATPWPEADKKGGGGGVDEDRLFDLCLQLEDMGFTNRARNESFLRNNRCDLAATIDSLIASSVEDVSSGGGKDDNPTKQGWTEMKRKEKMRPEEVSMLPTAPAPHYHSQQQAQQPARPHVHAQQQQQQYAYGIAQPSAAPHSAAPALVPAKAAPRAVQQHAMPQRHVDTRPQGAPWAKPASSRPHDASSFPPLRHQSSVAREQPAPQHRTESKATTGANSWSNNTSTAKNSVPPAAAMRAHGFSTATPATSAPTATNPPHAGAPPPQWEGSWSHQTDPSDERGNALPGSNHDGWGADSEDAFSVASVASDLNPDANSYMFTPLEEDVTSDAASADTSYASASAAAAPRRRSSMDAFQPATANATAAPPSVPPSESSQWNPPSSENSRSMEVRTWDALQPATRGVAAAGNEQTQLGSFVPQQTPATHARLSGWSDGLGATAQAGENTWGMPTAGGATWGGAMGGFTVPPQAPPVRTAARAPVDTRAHADGGWQPAPPPPGLDAELEPPSGSAPLPPGLDAPVPVPAAGAMWGNTIGGAQLWSGGIGEQGQGQGIGEPVSWMAPTVAPSAAGAWPGTSGGNGAGAMWGSNSAADAQTWQQPTSGFGAGQMYGYNSAQAPTENAQFEPSWEADLNLGSLVGDMSPTPSLGGN